MCILHSDYRWDFSTHLYIYVYMYMLQSDYRLVVLWERRLAGILFAHVHIYIYIFTDIYLYINMHVLFWLKSSRLKLKEVDRRAPTIPVSFIHATQAEAVGLVARTTGAA